MLINTHNIILIVLPAFLSLFLQYLIMTNVPIPIIATIGEYIIIPVIMYNKSSNTRTPMAAIKVHKSSTTKQITIESISGIISKIKRIKLFSTIPLKKLYTAVHQVQTLWNTKTFFRSFQ